MRKEFKRKRKKDYLIFIPRTKMKHEEESEKKKAFRHFSYMNVFV